MSATAILGIVLAVLVLVALVVFATTRNDARRAAGFLSRETRQRDETAAMATVGAAEADRPLTGREVERAAVVSRGQALQAATALAPAPYVPPDPEALGVTRRHFFNIGAITLTGVSVAGFGAACLAFIWPKLGGGFGSKINIGKIDDIKQQIRSNKGFYYLAEGRTWITEYPADGLTKEKSSYSGAVLAGMQAGIVALYQKCPHLGCRVPNCLSSQWFECPCHGSQYNRVGEKKGGPAPRGMDRFGVSIGADGSATIDTSQPVPGPPIGTNTTGQEAEGPHCINSAGGGEKH